MIIHTTIIDDDLVNVNDLKTKLDLFCPEVIIVAVLSSFSEAVPLLEGVHFDLLFIKYSPHDFDESDVRSAFADVDFSINTGPRETTSPFRYACH